MPLHVPMIAGIDFSTFAVDIVAIPLDPEEPLVVNHRRVELRTRKETGDLAAWIATSRVHDRIAENADALDGVELCFIERGHGKSRNNDWILGRVQGAVMASLPESIRANGKTWEVDIGEWKRGFTGNFHATKSLIEERALELGVTLPDDNAYDAFGIAWAMRSRNAAEIVRAADRVAQAGGSL